MGQFRNLVFEGGGVKGIAYAGAVEVLQRRGDLAGIRRVAGTSAGAITAALLAAGATAEDLERILRETNFASFMDKSWNVLRDLGRLATQYGWFQGAVFTEWMKRQIGLLTGGREEITFAELEALAAAGDGGPRRRRSLYTVATNLTTRRAEVFSAETTPDVPVWLAVRMSMSIPMFFGCVRRGEDVVVDGGVTRNYPIDLFDAVAADDGDTAGPADDGARPYDEPLPYNRTTLGFRVATSAARRRELLARPPEPEPVGNLLDYADALLPLVIEMGNLVHLPPRDWHRTVFIEAGGITAVDFELGDADIRMLVDNGRAGAERYFQWFDNPDPADPPLNRMP